MVSIPVLAIPVLNRYDLLVASTDSIDHPVDDLLIINNGPEPIGSNLFRTEHTPRVHVVNLPNNIGVGPAWNLTIKCFPAAPYWVFCGNDVLWSPGALKKLTTFASPSTLITSTYKWNAFCLGSEIVKKIGLMDENLWPGYYEDTDYEIRMQKAGLADSLIHGMFEVEPVSHGTTVAEGGYRDSCERSTASNEAYLRAKVQDGMPERRFELQRWIDNMWVPTGDRTPASTDWSRDPIYVRWD